MNSLKKKILAGLLSGAIIFTGGLAINSVQAADNSKSTKVERQRHERLQMTDEQRAQRAKEISERYGVSQAEVDAALKNRVPFDDIRIAAKLAKLSGRSFSEVLAMKVDWRQVAEKLGLTHQQIEEYTKNERLEDLANRSKLDKKTVESLLNDNYSPHDITIAGFIANESGKNVKNVIAKKKINNSWEDVAKEFKVDLSKLKNSERGRHFDKDDEEDFDD